MDVLRLLLVVLASGTFVLCARRAAFRGGFVWLARAAAVGAAAGAAWFLYVHGAGSGGARVATVAVLAGGGVGCYLTAGAHVKWSRAGAGVAALLGATLCAGAFLAQAVERDPHGGWARGSAAPGAALAQLERAAADLAVRERELVRRLADGIPAFRDRLHQQAAGVRAQLAAGAAGEDSPLAAELREISRLVLALADEEHELERLLARVRRERRRLDRLEGAEVHLADHAETWDELDRLEREARLRLELPLEDRLGTGVLEQARIDALADQVGR